jgi:hypothetical protein
MKKVIYLITTVLILNSCSQPITPEEKARLEIQIKDLNKKEASIRNTYNKVQRDLSELESQRDITKNQIQEAKTELGILKKGHQPLYILKCRFQEHKMELSMDRISFDFEIPVDERFYKESNIGEQLGSGSRSFSFFHSGDIRVTDKRIQ